MVDICAAISVIGLAEVDGLLAGIRTALLFSEEMMSAIFLELVIISGLYRLIGAAQALGS